MKINTVSNKKQGVTLSGKFGKVFPGSFVMLIVGPPQSGKTTFLINILKNPKYYGNAFDKIIYLTPSALPQITLNDKNHRSELDIQFINQTIVNMNHFYGQKNCNLLIVIDDLMSQFTKKPQLMGLINNRRHKLPYGTVSFIIITQKFNAIPNWVRVAINIVIVFKVSSKQAQTMAKQLSIPLDVGTFRTVVGRLGNKQFLIVNIQKAQIFDIDFEVVQ